MYSILSIIYNTKKARSRDQPRCFLRLRQARCSCRMRSLFVKVRSTPVHPFRCCDFLHRNPCWAARTSIVVVAGEAYVYVDGVIGVTMCLKLPLMVTVPFRHSEDRCRDQFRLLRQFRQAAERDPCQRNLDILFYSFRCCFRRLARTIHTIFFLKISIIQIFYYMTHTFKVSFKFPRAKRGNALVYK